MRNEFFDTLLKRRRQPARSQAAVFFGEWRAVAVVAVGVLSGLSLQGQGRVFLANSASSGVSNCYQFPNPPFYACEPLPLGTRFSVGLYYAPDGEQPHLLLRPTTSISPLPGRFNGGTRTTPTSTPPGGYAMFQVKIWETAFGATFEEALNAPPQGGNMSRLGISKLMRVRTGGFGIPPTVASQLPLRPIEVTPYPDCLSPPLPSPYILGPGDVTNTLGTSVLFEASPGPNDCVIEGWQWYLNGAPLGWATMPELYIPSVQFSDAGRYSVSGRIWWGSGNRSLETRLSVVAALSLSTRGSGTVQAEPNQATFAPYTNVVITATPAPGHDLLKWSGDATGKANPLVVMMDTNKTITAHFALKPRLEILAPAPALGGRLRLTGEVNAIYTVMQSENLEIWLPFLAVTNTIGTADFDFPAATNQSRFFKAIRFP
jgi:hypothetical protein